MENTVKINASLNELKEIVGEFVEIKLYQFLGDPDWGLELRDEVKTRLRKSLKAQSQGERGVPLEDAISKLGLKNVL